ncbi:MAG: DNA repair protein RadA, partial [Bdellovibrionales bacterium]|nr:DNA repair protein RadA [Bdellovibrionales bacterium]
MARIKSLFVCQECGAQKPRWQGKCDDCGAWNSFVEEKAIPQQKSNRGWSLGAKNAETSGQLKTQNLS